MARTVLGLVGLSLTLTLAACVDSPDLDGANEEGDAGLRELIGGVEAKPTDFPSMLSINGGGCTGIKVGTDRILTAAHCIWPIGQPTFSSVFAGQQIWVSNATNPARNPDGSPVPSTDVTTGYAQVRVTGAYLDPRWVSAKTKDKAAFFGATDLAIIVVANSDVLTLAKLPNATLDVATVDVGSPVVITGYGCDVAGKTSSTTSHLKYQKTKTVDDSSLADIAAHYFFTAGKDPSSAGACPGDDGAPVFRLDAAGNLAGVVGVTSAVAVSGSNIHTRFSDTWLGEVLANTAKPELFVAIDSHGTTCFNGGGTVIGEIDVKYRELGGCTGFLGLPRQDEKALKNGKFSLFALGAIYWSAATGAHEVHGPIWTAWAALGWENGALGYPTSDQTVNGDGINFSTFAQGAIYETKAGAFEVHGKIYEKWKELGLEKSPLGYPVSDEKPVTDAKGVTTGRQNEFEHGWITWTKNAAVVKMK